MSRTPICRNCNHLEQTAPTQVFWRCRWHSECPGGDVIRCHVAPETPACPHYAPKLDSMPLHGIDLLAMREVGAGVPASIALVCAGLTAAVAS
jgi:hypothetical protein